MFVSAALKPRAAVRALGPSAAVAAAVALMPCALAQTYTEVEPNDTRAAANLIPPGVGLTLAPGESIGGFTSGTSTVTPGVGSADYFRVKIAAAPLLVYKNRLTATGVGTSQNYAVTIQGYSQSGGVINTGSDSSVLSNSTLTAPRHVQWYGFGKGEEVNYKITGTSGASGTNGNYTVTYTSEAVTAQSTINTFSAGNITISSMGQTTVNTDFWVYDSNLDPIPGFGNDDNSMLGGGTGSGTQSICTRSLTPGTYYVAISTFNTANNQAAASDDRTLTNGVWETPNAISCSATSVNQDVDFVISDTAGTSEAVSAIKVDPFDIVFVQFTVGTAQSIQVTSDVSPAAITPSVTSALFTLDITPAPTPPNTINSVTIDLTALGGSASQALFDDATNGDVTLGDGVYSFAYTSPVTVSPGLKVVPYSVSDNGGRNVNGNISITALPVQPPNDECSGAVVLTDGGNMPYSATVGINLAQSDQQFLCQTSGTTSQNGIWYRYQPSVDSILEMRETGSRDVSFAIIGGACGAFQSYCETTETDANFIVRSDTVYYILVASPGAASTNANDTFSVTFSASALPAAPSNDECSTPIDLTAETFPYVATVPVGGARTDFDVSCNAASQTSAANAIWYSYTATGPIAIEIAETDTNTSGQFSVYSSCTGFELGCRLLGGSAAARNVIAVPGGETYLIMVSRNRQGTASADYDLNINIIPNPVPNGSCDTAIEFNSAPFVDTRQNVYAGDGPGISCITNSAAASRNATWYKHTPSQVTSISYRENSAQDAFIVIFTGACGSLTEYWCNTFSPLADVTQRVRLDAGQTYYFMVARELTSDVAITEVLTFQVNDISTASAIPANDLCSNAQSIWQTPYIESVFRAASTNDFKTNCSRGTASVASSNGIWYRYANGPSAGTGVVWTYSPDNYPSDTQIAVYAGTCPAGDLTEVTCDESQNDPEAVTFAMDPNTTYFILLASGPVFQSHADEITPFRFNRLEGVAPAPINGTCGTATAISSTPFNSFTWSANAPIEPIDVACNTAAATALNNAVWYSHTAAADGWAVFRENGPQDASIAVFTACPTAPGTEVRCASFSDVGVLQMTAGTTYYFVVGRFDVNFSGPGEYWDFHFDLLPNAGGNDLCENATVINTFPLNITTPTDLLTDDDVASASPCTAASPQRRGAWYTFTARDNFVLMAEEVGPQTGSRIYALFTGACGALTQVAGCSTNSSTTADFDFASPTAMVITAGQTYHLFVGSRAASVTNAEQRFYDTRIYTVGSDVGRCSTGQTCVLTTRQNCAGTFTPGAAPCLGDFNCMSGISVQDIFDFLTAYFSNDPKADINNSGGISVQDIFDFLALYFGGC